MTIQLRELKRSLVYGRWPKQQHVDSEHYSVVLACPMDMPFLLKLALEVLAYTTLDRCREILVVPDGSLKDCGKGLKSVIETSHDPRIRYIEPSVRWKMLMPYVHNHPAMMALATEAARCQFAFVHDLDAFLHSENAIEELFDEFRNREMVAMGITPRWDPAFRQMNVTIPGTWELFFDTLWLQRWPRQMVFGRQQRTPAGNTPFDSMLYPQYLEADSGRIGVSHDPPKIVHFNGTVRTFRKYQKRNGKQVTDHLFRLVLLSAIETSIKDAKSKRTTPEPATLVLGLESPDAPVRYNSSVNECGYAEFRYMVEQMCSTPVYVGDRAEVIQEVLNPFDKHFKYENKRVFRAALNEGEVRTSGL